MQSACMTTCCEAAGTTNSFVRWGTTQINWWSSLAYDCLNSLISWVAFHVLPGSSQSCVVVKCVIVCTRFCVAYSVSCKQMLSNQRAAMAAVWKVTRGLHWNDSSSCLVSLLQRHVEKAGRGRGRVGRWPLYPSDMEMGIQSKQQYWKISSYGTYSFIEVCSRHPWIIAFHCLPWLSR